MYRIIRNISSLSGDSGFIIAAIIACLLATAVFVFLVNPFHNFVKYTLINFFGDETGVRDGYRSLNPKHNIHVIGLLMSLVLSMGFAAPAYYDTKGFRRPKLYPIIISLSGIFSYFVCFLVFYFMYSTLKLNNVYDIASSTYKADNANFFGYAFYALYMMLNFLAITCIYSALLNTMPLFPLDMGDALYELLPVTWADALRNNELMISFGVFIACFTFLGTANGVIPNISSSIMEKVYSVFMTLYGV